MKIVLTWKILPDLEKVKSQRPGDDIKHRTDRRVEWPDLSFHIINQKHESINLNEIKYDSLFIYNITFSLVWA